MGYYPLPYYATSYLPDTVPLSTYKWFPMYGPHI